MSFVSVLKKIGQDALAVAGVAGEALPIINSFAPMFGVLLPASIRSKVPSVVSTINTDVGTVDNLITTWETVGQLSGMPGDQKIQAVSNAAIASFSDMLTLTDHEVGDADLLAKGRQEIKDAISKLCQGRVDILNAYKPKS
jgi:hypothetical protein